MPGAVVILCRPQADVPPDLRRQVLALHEEAWPGHPVAAADPLHDPALDPISMLLVDEGRVLSALDILSKEITNAGERFAASGLSTVVTASAERRKGHGRRLVEAARAEIARQGADLGIFTCDTPLGPFYERAGWTILPGTVLVGGTPQDPLPSDRFDKVTLGAFFTPRARAAEETFLGVRVKLYPGEIDRLW